jgi:hypothetical protein
LDFSRRRCQGQVPATEHEGREADRPRK